MSREQRSLCLSAARAYLFNRLLSERLIDQNWDRYLPGDVLNLNGSRSQFSLTAAALDNEQSAERIDIAQRLLEGDLHITGPLFGVDNSAAAVACEQALADAEPELVAGLAEQGLTAARRPLRAKVEHLEWHLDSDKLQLSFVLPTGSYATALLRELIVWQGAV